MSAHFGDFVELVVGVHLGAQFHVAMWYIGVCFRCDYICRRGGVREDALYLGVDARASLNQFFELTSGCVLLFYTYLVYGSLHIEIDMFYGI